MNYLDTEKVFFGRKDVLDVLNRRVADLKEGYRQNVAILGAPYVGKSSILYHFIKNIDESLTVIYLDLENKDFDYFLNKFIGSILYNFSKLKQLPLHDDINVLLEQTKKYIPQTVSVIQRIQKDYAGAKMAAAFQGITHLPEVYTNETGNFCVLVIDEFQNMADFNVTAIFQSLGKKIMTQKRCLYVMASSNPAEAQRIIGEKLSLLFGNFEILSIEPFDSADSKAFIEERLPQLKMGEALHHFLSDFTGGHPLYLDLICREIINLSAIHKQIEVFLPLLSLAIENTIFDRWGVLSRHFELLVNGLFLIKPDKVTTDLLLAIANGSHKSDEITSALNMKKAAVSKRMRALLDKGIIARNGKFHYYSDKLFKYWIKYVFQKRLRDIELSLDKQRLMFREEFKGHVEFFNASVHQDLSSRVVELLNLFDDESFQLNGRKYRLPAFKEVIPFKACNEHGYHFDFIKAKTERCEWFIITKKDVLSEPEFRAIMVESRKLSQKYGQCLIISLHDLDETTRLKALQERFWIWSEGELRALSALFDKPSIVR